MKDLTRIAVIDNERCKPKDCSRLCIRYCPMVKSRVEAIQFKDDIEFPVIIESLCSGCGICVKKCPFQAITITNLPEQLETERVHRYGPNAFVLYRLPIIKRGIVTGLVGRNGIGKTTALRILSGDIKPNLGNHAHTPSWKDIIRHFRGSPLQNYLQDMSENKLSIVIKPQNITSFLTDNKNYVSNQFDNLDATPVLTEVVEELELQKFINQRIDTLSGGELQRLAIGITLSKEADVYIFDEPSSHLDVYQRIKIAKIILKLGAFNKIVLVAEHDLAMLDYLSDQVCVLYGEPGVYGIVSNVHSARNGINIYLRGYIPDENMRFRNNEILFQSLSHRERKIGEGLTVTWPLMEFSYDNFSLTVESGDIKSGEIITILGANGIGKTTFIKLIAGLISPTSNVPSLSQSFKISYKPQQIYAKYTGTVSRLFNQIDIASSIQEIFEEKIVSPLSLTYLMDKKINQLSGGELQRVAIAACIARDADIYLLDEPSAYIDLEERLMVAKIIRETVEERKKYAFIVEHDLTAAHFLSDAVILFSGTPSVQGKAHTPLPLGEGMNQFLKEMGVTFRKDPETGRPRSNKPGSKMDRTQKESGEYYCTVIENH